MSHSISWKELVVVGSIIVITVLLYNIVFLLSFLPIHSGKEFVGLIGIPQWDMGVYYSMIEQVRQGSFLVHNLFTHELPAYGFFHPLWLVLGVVGGVLHISNMEVFFWSRAIGGVLLMFTGYALAVRFMTQPFWRVLVVFGLGWFGGWGRWLTLRVPEHFWNSEFVKSLAPVDLWWSEGSAALTMEHSILFILSQLLLVWLWWFAAQRKSYGSWLLGVGMIIIGLIHPYDIPIFWTVIIIWLLLLWLYKDGKIKEYCMQLIPAAVSTVLVILYYGWLLINDVTIAGWAMQNITKAPSVYAFITGYGWLLVFGIFGLVFLFKQLHISYDRFTLLVIAWFCALPFMTFVPSQISRRFVNSFGIIIVVVAVLGAQVVWGRYGKKLLQRDRLGIVTGLLGIILSLTLIFSPLFRLVDTVYQVVRPGTLSFLPVDIVNSARVLKQAPKDSVALSEDWGNILPGYSGRRVFFGHGHQTIDYDYKKTFVKKFFAPKTDNEWRQQFIADAGIDYVLWETKRVEELGSVWPVWYQNNAFTIYEVGTSLD